MHKRKTKQTKQNQSLLPHSSKTRGGIEAIEMISKKLQCEDQWDKLCAAELANL